MQGVLSRLNDKGYLHAYRSLTLRNWRDGQFVHPCSLYLVHRLWPWVRDALRKGNSWCERGALHSSVC